MQKHILYLDTSFLVQVTFTKKLFQIQEYLFLVKSLQQVLELGQMVLEYFALEKMFYGI